MDGRPHGIQMTPPGGGGLNTSELSVGRALIGALPFFVPCGYMGMGAYTDGDPGGFREHQGNHP